MAILDVLKDAGAWKQGLRTAAAGALSFLIAQYFDLPQGYWSVITAIMITQESMGATLQAVRDRLIGTFAGAVIGFLLAILTPSGQWGTFIGLTISIGWLAIFAARYPSLRIAPMTAAIMFIATPSHADVVVSAAHRVLEILVGCLIGVGVHLMVFPERAETLLRGKVAQVLSLLAGYVSADSHEAAAEIDRKLHDAATQMDKLAKQVQSEHFGKVPGSGFDPNDVNHALRHLRIAAFVLRRVTERVSAAEDATLLESVQAVNRAIQTYLLELSSDVNGIEMRSDTDADAMDKAMSRLCDDARAQHQERTADKCGGMEIVSSYKDAYDQVKIALNDLTSSLFGTSADNTR